MNPSSIKADLSSGSSLAPVSSNRFEEVVKRLFSTSMREHEGLKKTLDKLKHKIGADDTAEIFKKAARRVPVSSPKPVKFSSWEEVLEYSISSVYQSEQMWNIPEPRRTELLSVELYPKIFETFSANITDEMAEDYEKRIAKKVIDQLVEIIGIEKIKNFANKIAEILLREPDPAEDSRDKADESQSKVLEHNR